MKLKFLIILICPAFLFSCMTTPRSVVYFQDLNKYQQNIRRGNDSATYEPIIKKYDELLITVSAPILDQEAVAQFNLPMTSFLTPGETTVQQSPAIQTYIVDNEGTINYPVIGRISLAGLTKSQAIERIQKSVSNYVKDPVVNLKIISFQVTVLGEVFKPGTIPVAQEKISILDALGAVGDLTIYGDRKNVLLVRENNDGTVTYNRFDLTSSDLFSSPYYYLQQNDKIIVEPNKTRQLESKYGPADGYKLSVYSIIFSALSIIASTTIAIISLNR
ncbi:MAG: polysaccharide biosynthesis/export family protein [Candidatus Azobacteroides sp.]|nr:polysaccharide biosynthesis/export family protein [Candidatus Azobacteroides sp.]